MITPCGKPKNVVLVVLDDMGFGDLGCFGSSVSTPSLDALASGGLRFANFHVTPVCSPTRASLLTGRNAHSVGVGFVADVPTMDEHSAAHIRRDAGTVAEILRAAGYSTAAVGKWHLAPWDELSEDGPFDNWPLQRGFDRYFGFLSGMTDQFWPCLTRDNAPVECDWSPGYHVSNDIVDEAISTMRTYVTLDGDRPFFAYVAFGAVHSAHQAPQEYVDRYGNNFGAGWETEREQRLERQIELGLIPAGTELSEHDPDVPRWDELSPDDQHFAAALQRAYAGFLTHTDAQIGRLVHALDDLGELDDTLIMVLSDNGAAAGGGRLGTIDLSRTPDERHAPDDLERASEAGSTGFGMYAQGWAMASNTPFRRYKTYCDAGGIRVPLIVSWPGGGLDGGAVRHQYVNAIDVCPTVLDVLGVAAPPTIGGVEQQPIHGASFADAFWDAGSAETRDTQYYAMLGHRAIWHRGWRAVATHAPSLSVEEDAWQLFDTRCDASESHDVADQHPELLAELQDLWTSEAEFYGALPLNPDAWEAEYRDRSANREGFEGPIRLAVGRPRLPEGWLRGLGDERWEVSIELLRRPTNDGVLLTLGHSTSGVALYVEQGTLGYCTVESGNRRLRSIGPLPDGRSTVVFRLGEDRRAELVIDGEVHDLGVVRQAGFLLWGPTCGGTGGPFGHAVFAGTQAVLDADIVGAVFDRSR
jgi:arylsulfatase